RARASRARVSALCGVGCTSRLVRGALPDVLSFAEAVSTLPLVPAQVPGLADRGVVREGAAADLLVIDRDRLGTSTPRLVRDFPANSARFVVDASGYASVIVNGEVLLEDGRHTGALSGQVL